MWHILSSITVRLRIRLEGKAPFLQQSHDTVYANGKVDVVFGCVTNALKRGGHCFAHKKKVACAHRSFKLLDDRVC